MVVTRRSFLHMSMAAGAAMMAGHAGGSGRIRNRLRILILGGTGFLGPAIITAAKARGHAVTAFNRGRTETRRRELGIDQEFLEGVEVLYGNRDPDKSADDWRPEAERDPSAPRGLSELEGRSWDAAIDTSGYVPRIVRASAELLASKISHYTFISSVSVYASNSQPGADETDAVGKLADPHVEEMGASFENYGPLKALCEQAAELAMPGRVANVRPGLIVGPRDPTGRFTYWPARFHRGGEVLAPGTPDDPIQLIDVRDLAEWLVRLVETRTAGVFDALGPNGGLTMGGMLEACRATAGSDARLTWVDADFLKEQKVSAWGDMPVWIPPTGDSAGFHRRNVSKAMAAGLTFRPIGSTVRDTLTWWLDQPAERRTQLARGLSAEREVEVLAAWHKSRG